jgi:hypothetical protein
VADEEDKGAFHLKLKLELIDVVGELVKDGYPVYDLVEDLVAIAAAYAVEPDETNERPDEENVCDHPGQRMCRGCFADLAEGEHGIAAETLAKDPESEPEPGTLN